MRSIDYEQKVYDQCIKNAPSLEEFPDQPKLWRGRSGRSCVEKWETVIREYAMLHSRLRQAQRADPTGNPSEADVMRVAVGLFNKRANLSDMYDVINNKSYDIGKSFPMMNCYDLLCEQFPARIEPITVATTTVGVHRGGPPQVLADDGVDTDDGGGGESGDQSGGRPAGTPRSRPQGSKASKRARSRQLESDRVSEDIAGVSVFLCTYTEAFKSASDLSLLQDAANLQAKRLRASAASLRAGLDAFKTLFGADADCADRAEYINLLRQQEMQQARAAVESSTAAPQATEPSPGNALPVRSEVSSLSSRSHDRGVALAESDEMSVDVGFRCAASCKYSEFLIPSSMCPLQECNGDENGGARVHDECAQAV
jgi:hypothetical protein